MLVRQGPDEPWYAYDGDTLLVSEARELKKLTGMGLATFANGMKEGDVDAMVFTLYLARRRAGEAVHWRDFDDMNIADMEMKDDEPPPVTDINTRPPRAKGGKKATTG